MGKKKGAKGKSEGGAAAEVEPEEEVEVEQKQTASGEAAAEVAPAEPAKDLAAEYVFMCNSPDCMKPATMMCPTCIAEKLPRSHFCSQDCFKNNWKTHKNVHAQAKAREAYRYPNFDYTGKLRPHYVSPHREVPAHIQKPDYYGTGIPAEEQKERGKTAIKICSKAEIEGIRAACKLGREVLDIAHAFVKPGITTEELDKIVHDHCISRGAYPSPLYYHHFPKSCCTSVNEVICHGIPDARPLEDGDIVNVDISVYLNGYHGDLNETYLVGNVEQKYKDLIKTTYEALDLAIKAVKPGAMCRDFGDIINKHVTKAGFSVVKSYCGHGIGALFHSAPSIPHYSKNKAVGELKPGMVFTIEPMINERAWQDKTWPDDWTSVTVDGRRSAQFEHTLLVTEKGVEVLTARVPNSPPLWWHDRPGLSSC